MFPARNIAIGARADRRPARRRIVERANLRRAEGWIARRGDFSLPAFVCFLWSFLCTSKESGVPKTKDRTINNPANPQICRRKNMRMELPQSPSVTAPSKREPAICHLSQEMPICAEKDLIRRLRRHLSRLRARSRRGSDSPLGCHSPPLRCLRQPQRRSL